MQQAEVNRFVLDYLRHGPSEIDDLFRDAWSQFAFTREEIAEPGGASGIVPARSYDGVELRMHSPTTWSPSGGHARRCPSIHRRCQRRQRRVISRDNMEIFQGNHERTQINEETA